MSTELQGRWDQLGREHIPSMETTSVTLGGTSITVRCSCGDTAGYATRVPDTAVDACMNLVDDFVQVWAQLQILTHRNSVLLEEEGWVRQGRPATKGDS